MYKIIAGEIHYLPLKIFKIKERKVTLPFPFLIWEISLKKLLIIEYENLKDCIFNSDWFIWFSQEFYKLISQCVSDYTVS